MELVDLNDDVLIDICKYLDHKSKMSAMLTCKRLEHLIAAEFSRNFKLVITESNIFNDNLNNLRRKFVGLKLRFFLRSQNGNPDNFGRLCEILEVIGADVECFEISAFSIDSDLFLQILSRQENLKELKLDVIIEPLIKAENVEFRLNKLKKLVLQRANIEVINKIVPADVLDHLEISSSSSRMIWSQFQDVFINQRKLTTLILGNVGISSFKFATDGPALEKLSLSKLVFSNLESLDNFKRFIKNQKSIEELELDFCENFHVHLNIPHDILTHLLNLQTLKKVTIKDSCHIPELAENMKNYDSVFERIKITDESLDCKHKKFLPFFPRITLLELNFAKQYRRSKIQYTAEEYFEKFDVDVFDDQFPFLLRELEMSYLSQKMLKSLQSRNLRKLIITDNARFDDPIAWSIFTINTPCLEHLEIRCMMKSSIDVTIIMENVVKTLPHLKVLIIGEDFIHKHMPVLFFETMRKNCRSLEYFQVTLDKSKLNHYDYIEAFLNENFPNMQCEITDELKTKDGNSHPILILYKNVEIREKYFEYAERKQQKSQLSINVIFTSRHV